MRRFVTENSVYIIDEDLKRWMRLPRTEAGRQWWEHTEWYSPKLADNKWIEYRDYEIIEVMGEWCLRLLTQEAVRGVITSPIQEG